MSYFVVNYNLEFKLAKIIETYKNHDIAEILPEKFTRKIRPEHKVLALNIQDINDFQKALTATIAEIDSELLIEMLEDTTQKYQIAELAELYFGEHSNDVQLTALLFKLAANTVALNNYADGSFSKATPEQQQQRLARLQAAQLEEEQLQSYISQLIQLQNPGFDLSIDVIRLLHRSDKNSLAYKALTQASKNLNLTPLELAIKVGLIKNAVDFFVGCFMYDNFPQGTAYLDAQLSESWPNVLPDNHELRIFSIDDTATTEIDDAFSIVILQNGGYQVGVHIAAPALNTQAATIAADNISTIYYPGHKLPMLPKSVIEQFSLAAGKNVPVVSIYFNLDNEFNITNYNSKLELVTISANLRIEEVELLFNQDNLNVVHGYPYEKELKVLHNFANKLEERRGKPSVSSLVLDYNFSFANDKINIKPRLRGNPIDKLVSELMILANGTWGRMLTNAFIPAIYRVKQPNYPVKMTLSPNSHTGLNVDYYTWATSPLRRSVDYINQKQIISLILQDKQYFNTTNPLLVEVVENFDNKYAKYIDFQNKMERYWSLKYLIQENVSELNATFIFKSKVQIQGVPLELDLNGITTTKPRGTQIRLHIYNINPIRLSFDFKIIEEPVAAAMK